MTFGRRASRGTAIALVVTAVALAGFVWFCFRTVPVALQGKPDFPNYYFGGQRLLSGEPVYGPLAPLMKERFGVEPYIAYPADPPATVVLLSPLSLLPYETAWVVFATLSALLMAGVGYGVAREVGWARPAAVATAAVLLVTSPGRYLLETNHMEAILLLLLFLGWRSLRRGGETAAGVWWGIAAALKLFPALLIVGLVAARKTRGAVAAVVTGGVVTVLAVVLGGWDTTVAFVRDVLPLATQWYGALGNYSLLSFGNALAGTWLGWVLLVVGGGALVVWYSREATSADQIWIGGTAAALLITPLSWLNYLVLALAGVIVVLSKLDLGQVRDRWLGIGLVAALGFWGPVVLRTEVPSVLLSFVPTYVLIVLFVVATGRRERALRW
jgi:hypothetical protein